MSAFENLLGQVQSLKCLTCSGNGEYDDAEPGDISFRTFKCTACRGTGFKDGEAYQATPISSDSLRGRAEGIVSTGVAIGEIPVPVHSNSRE